MSAKINPKQNNQLRRRAAKIISLLAALVVAALIATQSQVLRRGADHSASQAGDTVTKELGARPTADRSSRNVFERLSASYGRLPLSFEANRGQSDGQVRFLSRGRGYTLFLTRNQAVLALPKNGAQSVSRRTAAFRGPWGLAGMESQAPPGREPFAPLIPLSAGRNLTLLKGVEKPQGRIADPALQDQSLLRMGLVGSNPRAKVVGMDELPGKSNYFIGNDPKKWRTDVPNYAKVKYRDVYPGIDLVYYGNPSADGQLEYDFVVAPGADPKAIRLDIEAGLSRHDDNGGVKRPLQIAANGDLVIAADGGEVRFHRPVVYQPAAAGYVSPKPSPAARRSSPLHPASPNSKIQNRKYLDGHYSLKGDEVSFELASYDRSQPLIIDPVLVYSTYLGGTGVGQANGIAVDSSGEAYVTGPTGLGFPTVNPIQTTGGDFVAKFNAAGSALIYSTYFGGSGIDTAIGIAVDSSGNAYVTGQACSADFPTTTGAFQSTFQGPVCNQGFGGDAFVVKLNAAGSALAYSTYLGGSAWEQGNGIGVDSSGNAYVTGLTESSDFPTMNPFQAACVAAGTTCGNAFVTKLNAAGSGLAYSTYLGGSGGGGVGYGIAVDSSGNAYVTGQSTPGFPIVNSSPFDPGACGDGAFVTKFTAPGTVLDYSTYIGCATGRGIAVDTSGNAYITGATGSTSLPIVNAVQPAYGGGNFDAFVSELDGAGTSLVYSTYLGGNSFDVAQGIAVDTSGNAYVTGSTTTDFPTANPIQASVASAFGPAFVTELSAGGSALVYSTYLGGTNTDAGIAIAVDSSGNAYVAGLTGSFNFPTLNAFQATCDGACGGDAFVSKIGPADAAAVRLPVALDLNTVVVGSSDFTSLLVENLGSATLTISGTSISGANSSDFAVTGSTCTPSVSGGGTCNLQITFTPSAGGPRTATLTITDNATNNPQTVPLSGTGIAPDFGIAVASGSPSTATVTAGGTATFTISVSPLGGFNQAVMLTCTGFPTLSTCKPSQPTVTLDGTNAATVNVTVTTTAPTISGPRGPLELPPPGGPVRNLWFLLAALLLLAVAATCRRRIVGAIYESPLRAPGLASALTLLTLLAWAACGGGGGGSFTHSPGTPAGTYTLTITGSSGGLSHSTTVTLTVQ